MTGHGVSPSTELFAQHAAWWKREAHLIAFPCEPELARLWLPLADGTTATDDLDLTPEMLDLDRLAEPQVDSELAPMGGGLLPVRVPYVRVPWMEAIAGCPIRALVASGSMRTHAVLTRWDELSRLKDLRDDAWLYALLALVERTVKHCARKQPISHTLMRGPGDIAEAMLGAERLCLAVYDRGEELASLLAYATALFVEVWREQASRIPWVNGGTVNWYGIWAPGSTVRTQCDASALTSPKQYAEHLAPWDLHTAQVADYSIMHLHSGSLHVIDTLLATPLPTAIQVSLDPPPSAPPWQELLPIFARILAHKPLLIDGYLSKKEAHALQDRLRHGGLAIIARHV
jgi:hypothetical protein